HFRLGGAEQAREETGALHRVEAGHRPRAVQGNARLRPFAARLHQNGGNHPQAATGLRVDVDFAERLDRFFELGHRWKLLMERRLPRYGVVRWRPVIIADQRRITPIYTNSRTCNISWLPIGRTSSS